MRYSAIVGGVGRAILWVTELAQAVKASATTPPSRTAKTHRQESENSAATPSAKFEKREYQDPLPACRSSQNAVKMPVDIGVLISTRVDWVLRAWRNLSAALHRCRYAR